jgi:hypothetical protein
MKMMTTIKRKRTRKKVTIRRVGTTKRGTIRRKGTTRKPMPTRTRRKKRRNDAFKKTKPTST